MANVFWREFWVPLGGMPHFLFMENAGAAPAEGGGDPGVGIGGPPGGAHALGGPPAEPAAHQEGGGEKPPAAPAVPKPGVEAPKPAAEGGGAPAADPAAVPAPKLASWPEEWRALLAGDDKKKTERLRRIGDPGKLFDSYLSLEQELSSGKYRKVLPTHYTDEELASYRKSNGIPEAANGYDTNIGDGVVWGEADREHIENFTEFAHQNNWTPKEVKDGLRWWHQYQEVLLNGQNEADAGQAQEASAGLRADWGGKHAGNLNFLKSVFDREAGLWTAFTTARGPDGRLLGNDPKMLKFVHSLMAQADPYAAEMPGVGQADASRTLAAEKAEIRSKMGDKGSDYWRGPNSVAMQERYRQILELEGRMAAAAGR